MQNQNDFTSLWLNNAVAISKRGVIIPTLAAKRYTLVSVFEFEGQEFAITANIDRKLVLLEMEAATQLKDATFEVDIFFVWTLAGKSSETKNPSDINIAFDPSDELDILTDATHWDNDEFQSAKVRYLGAAWKLVELYAHDD